MGLELQTTRVNMVSLFCPNWDRVPKLTRTHQNGHHHGLSQPCVPMGSPLGLPSSSAPNCQSEWPYLTLHKDEPFSIQILEFCFKECGALSLSLTSVLELSQLVPICPNLSQLIPTHVLALSKYWDGYNILSWNIIYQHFCPMFISIRVFLSDQLNCNFGT